MEKQQDKQKLTVEGQVQDMKEKDIKFEICSEEDAKKIYSITITILSLNRMLEITIWIRRQRNILTWILHIW